LSSESLAKTVVELCGDRPRLAAMADRARANAHPEASREIAAAILTL
jgi:UDP-N-acetylglucosamine:LPS N-acetylglucosamine transferase